MYHTIVAFSILVAACTCHGATLPSTDVKLRFGTVKGNLLEKTREFLGIPFAQPPVRFAPPVAWSKQYPSGGIDARSYSPACVQLTAGAGAWAPMEMSEDCLYLNVYTPHRAVGDDTPLPVMLWIHGGGLSDGTAMSPFYNGSKLSSSQQVVVVAINYRLNVFGFSPIPAAMGANTTATANNGFKDQREAMRWVRAHIAAFGGDDKSITIFGESAGGQSVATHLVSPGSAGLFDRAISESGDITSVQTLAFALNATAQVADALSCTDIACLRHVNATELLNVAGELNLYMYQAVIDGVVLPGEPVELAHQGAFNRVPYMFGNNHDEGSLFFTLMNVSARAAKCIVNATFGSKAQDIFGLYPVLDATPYGGVDNRGVMVELLSDFFFHCGNRRFALALDASHQSPWMYSFNRHPSCPISNIPGAAHASEIAFVFQGLDLMAYNTSCVVPQAEYELAEQMSTLWAYFARHGEAPWPRFEAPKGSVLKLDIGMDMKSLDLETGYRRGQCDTLDKLGVYINGGSVLNDFFAVTAACSKEAHN